MTLFEMKGHQKEDKNQPDPDQLYTLVGFGWRAHILKAAIQLDVFTAIANGCRTVEQIASAKNWLIRPTRLLLDSLCSLGLLTKNRGEYSLTPTAAAFLVADSDTYAGGSLGCFLACDPWHQLSEVVRTGQQTVPDACSSEFSAFWVQDASMEALRTSRIAESVDMWRSVGIDPDAESSIRVLDLASGCGIKSLVLAKNNRNADITCMDWAGVLEVAKQLAAKWRILKQVRFRDGDITTMDYGDSEFDAVLLGQITYYLSIDQNKSVLRRAYRALKPGGLVVIHVPIADEERCKSEALILAVVLFIVYGGQGDSYTFSEHKAMLEDAGFSKITKHSDSLISARKQ